jgi:hypothetical protein
MARPMIDRRTLSQGRRTGRERGFWHRSEAPGTNRRRVEFLRIAQGRTA